LRDLRSWEILLIFNSLKRTSMYPFRKNKTKVQSKRSKITPRKELRRRNEYVCLKISRKLSKTIRAIPKDGFQNGRGRATRRKASEEQVRLKV
jgi:hypothetical protein